MTSSSRMRRVRTGCLTCRERHLKCDEQTPECLNCLKSNRFCDRSRRITFGHRTMVHTLQYVAKSEWPIGSSGFCDESRSIARLYEGGEDRYSLAGLDTLNDSEKASKRTGAAAVKTEASESELLPAAIDRSAAFANPSPPSAGSSPPLPKSQQLPADAVDAEYGTMQASLYFTSDAVMSAAYGGSQMLTPSDTRSVEDAYATPRAANTTFYDGRDGLFGGEDLNPGPNVSNSISPPLSGTEHGIPSNTSDSGRAYLSDPEDIQHMQAFIDDVAGWMNAFDGERHLEKSLPQRALKCPALLSALLTYGASFTDEGTAKRHYVAAAQGMQRIIKEEEGLRSVDGAARDDDKLVDMAAAAVVLYVYEMTTGTVERTSAHASVAMDLLSRGGWDGSSPGLGGACFWLFTVTEVQTCLAMNWRVTWAPGTWAVDRDMSALVGAREEDWVWVRRIFYVLFKVSDFCAEASEVDTSDPKKKIERMAQWHHLENLCREWRAAYPQTMSLYAYIDAGSPGVTSRFPVIRFSTFARTFGRLCYHTSLCLLARMNPSESTRNSKEMRGMELHHAQQACGIIATASSATTRLRPEAAVACLVIAKGALQDPQQKDEVAALLRLNQGCTLNQGSI